MQLTNDTTQASASRPSTAPPAASKASPTKTSSSPIYPNTASSSSKTTRTEAPPATRAPAFPSPISQLRTSRARWLRVPRMCTSFAGVALAVANGRGRGWRSLVAKRLLIARVSQVVLPARMLTVERVQRLVVTELISLRPVACWTRVRRAMP